MELGNMPIEKQKLVLILRGLPGTGKTYLAKEYLSYIGQAFGPTTGGTNDLPILSSDDFFVKDKVYHFDKDKLSEAHKWNWERFKIEVDKGSPLIIVDNTNIKKFHYYLYLDYAQRHNYLTAIILMPHNDVSNKELAERNIHGVDSNTIRRMKNAFEWELS